MGEGRGRYGKWHVVLEERGLIVAKEQWPCPIIDDGRHEGAMRWVAGG